MCIDIDGQELLRIFRAWDFLDHIHPDERCWIEEHQEMQLVSTTETLNAVLVMGSGNLEYTMQCVKEAGDNALGNYKRMRNHWPDTLLKKRKVSAFFTLLGL